MIPQETGKYVPGGSSGRSFDGRCGGSPSGGFSDSLCGNPDMLVRGDRGRDVYGNIRGMGSSGRGGGRQSGNGAGGRGDSGRGKAGEDEFGLRVGQVLQYAFEHQIGVETMKWMAKQEMENFKVTRDDGPRIAELMNLKGWMLRNGCRDVMIKHYLKQAAKAMEIDLWN